MCTLDAGFCFFTPLVTPQGLRSYRVGVECSELASAGLILGVIYFCDCVNLHK